MLVCLVRKRLIKAIALFLLLTFTQGLVVPSISYALTSGPSQPEVQSFQSIGTSEMVDLFSGDFNYNIPLFELPGPNGGYPFNIAYQSGIGMDQEASWVGLGWNLNVGAITRQMRGLPDDFQGDIIEKEVDMKPMVTYGANFTAAQLEFLGAGQSSLGVRVYYNNYKGLGYSYNPNLAYTSESGLTTGMGMSLDSQNGLNLSPTIGFEEEIMHKDKTFIKSNNVTFNFSSRDGLSNIALGQSISGTYTKKNKKGENVNKKVDGNVGSSISLLDNGHTPFVNMPMSNKNFGVTLKAGFAKTGFFAHTSIYGFYQVQSLKNTFIESPAYGYMYSEYAAESESSLLDVNRQKDGMIHKKSPHLAMPSFTYDIFSVNGQGISGMYRVYRSDVGILHDQEKKSKSYGLELGFDLGGGDLLHLGFNGSGNISENKSGLWKSGNKMVKEGGFAFKAKSLGSLEEPSYFKPAGETTTQKLGYLDYIGGESPVRVKLKGFRAENKLVGKSFNAFPSNNDDEGRRKKNTSIVPITNKELLDDNGEEILDFFKIDYYSTPETNQLIRLDRTREKFKENHLAGFIVTNTEGLRYIYALPAYNTKQIEAQFSIKELTGFNDKVVEIDDLNEDNIPDYKVPLTNEFYSRTKTPAYTHAFLLTSVVGPDYVDADNIPGPSEGDLGYWVKFNYAQGSSEYKWRAPFFGANYNRGLEHDPEDDQGSYMYGTKETWYLKSAETKSHVAQFDLRKRFDARGAAKEIQNIGTSISGGAYSYRISNITLYSRKEHEKLLSNPSSAEAIKKIHFQYDYSLCQGLSAENFYQGSNSDSEILNQGQNQDGKLTLKKLWFTYGKNTRGAQSPYEFSYGAEGMNNPDYNIYAYDRWGNYKPTEHREDNMDFPYHEQDENEKANYDKYASAWSLDAIKLPSGGDIKVTYEADDYAYVQNRTAMQMTEISSVRSNYDGTSATEDFNINQSDYKIYFPLEEPIPVGDISSSAEQEAEVNKYLDLETNQLFYKVKVNLRSAGERFYEFVAGYADLAADDRGLIGNGSHYTHGYFKIEPIEHKGKQYHPFSVAAWQHLQTTQPQLSTTTGKLPANVDTDETERIKRVRSLVSQFEVIKQLLKGYYGYAKGKDWGEDIEKGKAWVRLKSIDKIKYGGGVRVKKIELTDAWNEMVNSENNHEETSTYGQVYDYTTIDEETGSTISSGVAAYEPMIGGDENPMRYAKKYEQARLLKTNNNLFFEYPVNEGFFPGPQVGYSKVTVKSLASQELLEQETPSIFHSTTGATVQEFYTAKDYPVITDFTRLTDFGARKSNFPHPIRIISSTIVRSKMTASQGYSIILNDMHGKPKKVSNYAQDKNGDILWKEPISWVEYHYKDRVETYKPPEFKSYITRRRLINDVPTIEVDENRMAKESSENSILGQDHEFFIDMREHSSLGFGTGVKSNAEIFTVPPLPLIPVTTVKIPAGIPNLDVSTTSVRTAVANKIIHKTGILERTVAYDGGSKVETRNLLWDKVTGEVLLTSVQNNFERPIFSYNIPAYYKYPKMGAAYQNVGLTFEANLRQISTTKYYKLREQEPEWAKALVAGDEFILNHGKGLAVYVGKQDGVHTFYSETVASEVTSENLHFYLYRSGYRNILSAKVGGITTLVNPFEQTDPLSVEECEKKVMVPVIEE